MATLFSCLNPFCSSRKGTFSTLRGLEQHLDKSLVCKQVYLGKRLYRREEEDPPTRLHTTSDYFSAEEEEDASSVGSGASHGFDFPQSDEEMNDIPRYDAYYQEHFAAARAKESKETNIWYTNEQRALISLMKLVQDMNAPDGSFQAILEWAQRAYDNGFNFRPEKGKPETVTSNGCVK